MQINMSFISFPSLRRTNAKLALTLKRHSYPNLFLLILIFLRSIYKSRKKDKRYCWTDRFIHFQTTWGALQFLTPSFGHFQGTWYVCSCLFSAGKYSFMSKKRQKRHKNSKVHQKQMLHNKSPLAQSSSLYQVKCSRDTQFQISKG